MSLNYVNASNSYLNIERRVRALIVQYLFSGTFYFEKRLNGVQAQQEYRNEIERNGEKNVLSWNWYNLFDIHACFMLWVPQRYCEQFQVQVSETLDEKFIHSFEVSQYFSNPANAEIRGKAISAVENYMNCRKDISLAWDAAESNVIKWSVALFQIFLDIHHKSNYLLMLCSSIHFMSRFQTFKESI